MFWDVLIGIEDFVVVEILHMLDTDRYVERFKEHLKNKLLAIERGSKNSFPVLKKKPNTIGTKIKKQDPGEQKTAIGYFLDRIEVLWGEGIRDVTFATHRAFRK